MKEEFIPPNAFDRREVIWCKLYDSVIVCLEDLKIMYKRIRNYPGKIDRY